MRPYKGAPNVVDYDAKMAAYKRGEYRFKCPPVCTAQWGDAAWVVWIDGHKGWRDQGLRETAKEDRA